MSCKERERGKKLMPLLELPRQKGVSVSLLVQVYYSPQTRLIGQFKCHRRQIGSHVLQQSEPANLHDHQAAATFSCSLTFLCLCLCPFVSPPSNNPYFFNLTMALRIPQGTQMLKDGYKVSLSHSIHLHSFDIHTLPPYLSSLFSPSLSQEKRRKTRI